ncbi:leucine-rich repeat domain-containing protein [Actinomadura craniellae]|uniref:Leucine-rich repeat domain-containing protein n=1 Tax=Actinomadura craniellae TaxID=2231787 RepID=A0A365GVQ7_9ACTN|nr:leucine-rich repeat domain-containing protein [Actinomadura craniellae]
MTLPERNFPTREKDAGAALPDAAAVAWRLDYDREGEEDPDLLDPDYASYFARFLRTVDTTRVRELVFGSCGEVYFSSCGDAVEVLAGAADRFPALRAIALGDIADELAMIVQADVTPLLRAFPALEVLEVRGGSNLELEPVRHASLRVLRLEAGGLSAGATRAVAASDLPALEHLELWLGDGNHGGDATPADLAPILTGERLPSLRYLGLLDGEFQDEIAAAVASAPVVARLETLDLSLGELTDRGGEALLAGQPLTHLKKLDLSHHSMSEAMTERLRAALPGVEVALGHRRKGGFRYSEAME